MKRIIKTSMVAILMVIILFYAAAGGAALAEAGMLKLPTTLKRIETEAFSGDQDIRNVVVPEGVERIGARAFRDSGLRMIQLPASVTAIDGDPFDGPDMVRIVAPEGTYASQWAEAHGYTVSHEAQKWVVDKAAWTETTERRYVAICQGCGRYFLTYNDYQAHIKKIRLAKLNGDTQAIYEETAGGLTQTVNGVPREPDRTGSSCGAYGTAYINVPLDEPIEHPEEGHYETVP